MLKMKYKTKIILICIFLFIIGIVVAHYDPYNLGALGVVISYAVVISFGIIIGKELFFKEIK